MPIQNFRGLESPPRGPGEVGILFHRARMGQESHPEVQELLRGPPRGLGGVGKPSQMTGRGREALLQGREGSGGLSGGLREVEGLPSVP